MSVMSRKIPVVQVASFANLNLNLNKDVACF